MSNDTCSPLIDSYLPEFALSEPVFKLVYDDYWGCVRMSHAEEHKAPQTPEQDNAIANIGIAEFSESFNSSTKKFSYNRAALVGTVLQRCIEIVTKYFMNHSALKKPKTSATYRFLLSVRNKATNTEQNDDVVRVARYILEYQVNRQHQQNILALINALKEKYDS
jgi:hypothetical protein